MLIQFDISCAELAAGDKVAIAQAVAEILRAHRRGYHLLVVDYDRSAWLLDNVSLSEPERATLKQVAAGYSQTAGLVHDARLFARIASCASDKVVRTSRSIEVSLSAMLKTRLLEQSVLLVENAKSDGQLYTYILDALRPVIKAPRVSFDVMHGGGDDISSVFEMEIKKGRVLCCIVDSDCGFPGAPKSPKVHKIAGAVAAHDWKFALVKVLPCREIENLIPISVLHSLPCAIERYATVKVLLAIEQHEQLSGAAVDGGFWLYFDAKQGLVLDSAEELPEAERSWITGKLRKAGIQDGQLPILGFGLRIVEQLLRSPKHLAEFNQKLKEANMRGFFIECFQEIVWLGAAPVRSFT